MQYTLYPVFADAVLNNTFFMQNLIVNEYYTTLETIFIKDMLNSSNSIINPFSLTESILNNPSFNQFINNISNEHFVNDLSEYCNAVLNSSPKISFIKSEFLDMAPEFKNMETQIRRRHIRFPHLTREEI